jgi:hypothetical protein
MANLHKILVPNTAILKTVFGSDRIGSDSRKLTFSRDWGMKITNDTKIGRFDRLEILILLNDSHIVKPVLYFHI